MTKPYSKSLPYKDWPTETRDSFRVAFRNKTESRITELRQLLGRWLLEAKKDGLPPTLVTPHLIERRTKGLCSRRRSVMKQVIFEVFGATNAFVPAERMRQRNERDQLSGVIQRNIHRFPEAWRCRALPKLQICPDGLADGEIIDLRSSSSIESMILVSAHYFDFCRKSGLKVDLIPVSFRGWVRHRREMFAAGSFSIYSMAKEASLLLALGRDLYPGRDWEWLAKFYREMKKSARTHSTRANQRFVVLEELRIAALQGLEAARQAHENASGYQAKLQAHTLARTLLSVLMLIISPIRISSLTGLDLEQHFDPDLSRLYLAPTETKDRNRDERAISNELRAAISAYLTLHRPLVAPEEETRLFVGRGGAPCSAGHLSECIGDMTEALFGSRISAHMIRNVVAAFIVSESPAEKELATEVLNHRRSSTTDTYSANSSGIVASRQLAAAADKQIERLGLNKPKRQKNMKRVRSTAFQRAGG